jgi:hypothetical protein
MVDIAESNAPDARTTGHAREDTRTVTRPDHVNADSSPLRQTTAIRYLCSGREEESRCASSVPV